MELELIPHVTQEALRVYRRSMLLLLEENLELLRAQHLLLENLLHLLGSDNLRCHHSH